jgi:hypothetical protein
MWDSVKEMRAKPPMIRAARSMVPTFFFMCFSWIKTAVVTAR